MDVFCFQPLILWGMEITLRQSFFQAVASSPYPRTTYNKFASRFYSHGYIYKQQTNERLVSMSKGKNVSFEIKKIYDCSHNII